MLSVKNEYARADIERLLQEHTDRMGISREELNKEIREGLSCYDLLCTLTGDMIQTVRERESAELRRRQREGMTRAQEQGVTLGRPSKRSDKRFDKIRAMYEKKEISAEEASKRLHLSISTFYRWLRQSRKADVEERIGERSGELSEEMTEDFLDEEFFEEDEDETEEEE